MAALDQRLAQLRSPVVQQAVRFLIVGGGSYVLNLSLYSLGLALGLHYLTAAASAYLVGFGFNFLANRHWTFAAGSDPLDAQIVRFTALAAVILVLDLLLLRVAVGSIGVPSLPAQAIVILLLVPISFVGNRFWSFASRGSAAAD
jgi:putative flippase GtrA